MSIEAMKLALEFADDVFRGNYKGNADEVITALRQAIEQAQKQEPVAWANRVIGGRKWLSIHASKGASDRWLEYRIKEQAQSEEYEQIQLYTSPPQRQPLTWQPIETAPKDGTDVLVMYIHINTQVVYNGFWIGADDTDEETDIGWWSYEHSEVSRIKLDDWMTPTHWLPLPDIAAHGIKEKS